MVRNTMMTLANPVHLLFIVEPPCDQQQEIWLTYILDGSDILIAKIEIGPDKEVCLFIDPVDVV